MQFKKFEAVDMRAALAAVKKELGADAMIVATRQIDGGLFKKPRLEVTAAFEEDAAQSEPRRLRGPEKKRRRRTAEPTAMGPQPARAEQQAADSEAGPRPSRAATAAALARYGQRSQVPDTAEEEPTDPAGSTSSHGSQASQVAPSSQAAAVSMQQRASDRYAPAEGLDDPLDLKLDPLRRELQAMRRHMADSDQDTHGPAVLQELAALREMVGQMASQGGSPVAVHDALGEVLAAADVEPAVATELIGAARARAERNLGDDGAPLLRDELVALKQVIAAEVAVDTSFFSATLGPRRIALIGPTGVGKTTTIAKIAAHAALVHHRKVALISLDTYRVAAFEQLRQYASLIDVPLTVARDAASFKAAIVAYQDADLILIDTAGRGTADKSHHSHLCELFSTNRVQAYLALSAATRRLELRGILRAFAALDPQALVFTKLDEAMALGAVVNASRACQVPLTFVTHGQRVPEDLSLPDATDLAARLVHTVLDASRGRRRAAAARPGRRPPAASPLRSAPGAPASSGWRGYSDHDAQ
jgi:flagellar biosynthesis protein FlhF